MNILMSLILSLSVIVTASLYLIQREKIKVLKTQAGDFENSLERMDKEIDQLSTDIFIQQNRANLFEKWLNDSLEMRKQTLEVLTKANEHLVKANARIEVLEAIESIPPPANASNV